MTFKYVFLISDSQEARSIKKLPTLIHSGLVAVYGTVVLNRIVLFLGTDDGQLLKVSWVWQFFPSPPSAAEFKWVNVPCFVQCIINRYGPLNLCFLFVK